MSTVKISQLPEIRHLNADTTQSLTVGVDLVTGETGKYTIKTLAEGLFSNDVLKVGQNQVQGTNVIAQFSGNAANWLQVTNQNYDANGSTDFVAQTSDSDNLTSFIDMGINGSLFSDATYSAMSPYDAYLFNHGPETTGNVGNLVIGTATSGANINFIAGGTTTPNIVAKITSSGISLNGSSYFTFTDGSKQYVAAAPANLTQSAFNLANTNANNIVLVNQYAGGAYAKANAALANTTGTFEGDLTITGSISLQTVTTQNSIIFRDGSSVGYNATLNPATILFTTANNLLIHTNQGESEFDFNSTGFSSSQGMTSSGNTNLLSYVTIQKNNISSSTPLVTINAADSGVSAAASNSYYMMHITGKSNNSTRFVLDSFGANTYPLISGRMGRGSSAAPAAVANNDVLMRIVGNGYTGTQFASSSPSKIDFVATEAFSDTNRGTAIQFWNTPNGSNTIQKIASFNATEVSFTGAVYPQKGFIYTPVIYPSSQTAITIDMSDGPLVRAQTASGLTVTLSNFVAGKVVELWVTNTAGTGQTFTHGVSATNSTVNSTTYTIPSTSTICVRYVCFDATLANTMCSIIHS